MARRKKNPFAWCKWTVDEFDGSWDTECGHKFQFTDGGPRENGLKFCGYCGCMLAVCSPHPETKGHE